MMKTFILLFCTSVFSFTTSNMLSQNAKIEINLDKSVTVDEVFDLIMDQTKYTFIYQVDMFKDFPRVELQKGIIRANKLLEQSFSNEEFEFELTTNNTIVIKRKLKVQQIQISGKVVDENDEPLPGVSIIIKGSTRGTETDFDGAFTVDAISGDVLVFSFIGLISQEVSVGEETTLNITLAEDENNLEEVVVVGYGTRTKSTLTGAVSTLNSESFESNPGSNILNSIQGAIPGLSVTRSSSQLGNEGGAIEIRGVTSRNGVGVLTIIDGIPQRSLGTSAFESLNPEDIESFTVLKDAQAAIYGARAAGGVILITTKKGTSETPTIRFTSNLSINTVGNYLARTDVKQHSIMFDEAWSNDGVSPIPFLGQLTDEIAAADLSNPTVIGGPFSDTPTLWLGHNEWMETMWGDSLWQNYNLSVSGKSDRSNYFTSFQYLDQESQLQYGQNSNKKFSFRGKYDYEIIEDKLTIGTNISLDEQTTETPNRYGNMLGAMQSAWTSQPVTTPEGNFYNFGGFNSPNGYAELGGENELIRRNVNLQFNAEFTPIKGLKIIGQYATNRELDESKNLRRIFRYHNYDETPGNWGANRNSIYNGYGSTTHNTANLYGTYTKSIGSHNMSLMVGGSHEEDFNNGFDAWRNDLSNEDYPILDFGDPEEQYNSEDANHVAIKSLFSEFTYNYKGKYIFDATLRRDKSSRFAEGFREGYFPGVSAGWVVTKEDFMENSSNFINYLKLRLSWGELGNQNNVGRFDHISRIGKGGAPLFGPNGSPVQANSAFIPSLADPNRSWETVEVRNIGLEYSFLSSRLSGKFDYFNKHTKDMLIGLEFPETLGIATVTVNGGELKTEGYEIELGWRDNIKDFNYSVRATFSNDTNEVTKLDDNRTASHGYNGFLEGHSTDTYYGFAFDGFMETQADVDEYKTVTATNFSGFPFQPGDARYRDTDGDGVLEFSKYVEGDPDSGDLIDLGDGRRHDMFAVNFGFDYKGFDLSAFFQGVGRWDVYNSYSAMGGDWWNQPFAYTYNQNWSPERQNAPYPRLSVNGDIDWNNHQIQSDAPYRKVNNAYVRLKNLQVGYSLQDNVIDNLGLSKLRVYFSGIDLWEAHNLPDGFDPERPFAVGYTPFVRSYSFGIDLTF